MNTKFFIKVAQGGLLLTALDLIFGLVLGNATDGKHHARQRDFTCHGRIIASRQEGVE